jgi:hypothetical protein
MARKNFDISEWEALIMDAKERLLRNEIRKNIDLYIVAGYEVQEEVVNDLFEKFYIIPKEKAIVSVGIDGRTVITVEPWDLEPLSKPEPTPRSDSGINTSGPCGGI